MRTSVKAENITKYSEVKKETYHGQTDRSNMLVKKNVLNEIKKKEHSLKVSRFQGLQENQKESISKI